MSDFINPEEIEIIQPRVARNELPWVNGLEEFGSTLKGLNQSHQWSIDSTLSGLRKNPVRLPRVARSSQPWAELWNPVGF